MALQTFTRRTALVGGAAFSIAGAAKPAAGPLKVVLLGQALIQNDLREHPWPDFDRFKAEFAKADVVFTNLETVIDGPGVGQPTRELITLHRAPAAVLDCLKELSVDILASSNNHAYDLGAGGILSTLQAVEARGLPCAGLGRNLEAAAAPAVFRAPRGAVAVVACATGSVRPGGAATPDRPGVNEIRREPSGELNEEDVGRYLAAIRRARSGAEVVLAYNHNHYWEPDNSQTPEWQRRFAKRSVDAGASAFVAHGAPLVQGVELYRGAPLFYDLGSFIFQTETGEGRYPDTAWRSLVAECSFQGGRFVEASLTPVRLNEVGVGGREDLETRGRPHYAAGAEATRTLADFAAASRRFGARVTVAAGRGRLRA